MTEEQSKRREFLPLVFIVNSFKKPLQKSLQISAFHCYRGKKNLIFNFFAVWQTGIFGTRNVTCMQIIGKFHREASVETNVRALSISVYHTILRSINFSLLVFCTHEFS